jgi:multidrug transporter EmrE-like cation transporter
VGWALGLQYSEGFTRFWPQESAEGPRLIFIAIIVLGVIGLKMTSRHE